MAQPIDKKTGNLSSAQMLLAGLQAARAKIEELEGQKTEPIAIVGLGCRFPGSAINPQAFWDVLHGGREVITEVPKERWDIDALYDPDPEAAGKMYCRRGGFLRNIADFDPSFFRISRREATSMDPQQRLLLEVCWEALENAGCGPVSLRNKAVGAFVGISTFDFAGQRYTQHDYKAIDAYFASGGVLSVAAGRLSYVLGLTGPSMAVDTACSSSLVAVHLACQSLRNRECTMALAGGVNVILSPELSINFSRARMLAPDGRCKTFDAAADGYVRGEGCGVIVLKRLTDALAAGDRIMALIRGSAVNQDGPSSGMTVPSGPAQEAVIRQALANSGVKAEEVGFVEAHGTGTSLGDPIEVGALGKVFADRSSAEPLLIGSVKTNIGHLEAASGIAGLIKVVLSLQAGEIPAHLHFHEPNPNIEWRQLPIEVARQRSKWPAGKERIAGVSSFGFMGTNAHIILAAGPVIAGPENEMERPCHILALSAKSGAALQELAGRFVEHLAGHPAESLADLCYTANCGRSHFAERLAVTGSSGAEIAAGLRTFSAGRGEGLVAAGPEGEPGRLAIIFPAMIPTADSSVIENGLTLYETAPLFRRVLDRCGEYLRDRTDRPLLTALSSGGALGQAALFALECGLFELWKSWGIEPTLVMGHGVGEYGAAYAAGVCGLEEGLNLAFARGLAAEKSGSSGAAGPASFAAVAAATNFRKPAVGFVSSLTGLLFAEETDWDDYWLRQLDETPESAAGADTLAKEGVGIILEMGPRSILPGHKPGHKLSHLASLAPGEGDWPVLLGSLAELYELGMLVNWQGFDHDYRRSLIALPTYPFQRQRYWLEEQSGGAGIKGAALRPRAGSGHPILGARLATAHRDLIFESLIGKDSPAFLAHHQIYGATVFPATGYVEMALAAGVELLGTERLLLEDFTIEQPLILPAEAEVMVQTVLSSTADGGYGFAIHSEGAGGRWLLHASGRIRSDQDDLAAEKLGELQDRCRQGLSVSEHYREFGARGIAYGPDFQGLRKLTCGQGESLGYLEAPAGIMADLAAYVLHPALFDGGLQAAGILLPAEAGEGYFPVGIGRLRIGSRLPGNFWSYGRLHGLDDRSPGRKVDFSLYDDQGVAVLQVEGLAVKRATRETLLRSIIGSDGAAAGTAAGGEDLYDVAWQPAPLPHRPEVGKGLGKWLILADQHGLGEGVAAELRRRGAETTLVHRGEAYRQESGDRYWLNPLVPEDFNKLLQEGLAGWGCQGVLHLWSLDSGTRTDQAAIEDSLVLGCGSALHLVQALGRVEYQPRLWLVTRGAQQAGSRSSEVAVHQAPLWGFARTLALEHPGFRTVCLDLDPAATTGGEMELIKELVEPDDEGQIAWREGARYGARLVRAGQKTAASAAKAESVPRRIKLREYGIIDNLSLEPMARTRPGRGEVEIEVRATGLNFRDVLRALGMLKDYEPQLQDAAEASFGFECSGLIAAVGEGVRGLRVGDEVIAGLTAAGSMGAYTTVAAACVAKKPGWMSHQEGATIPLAFLTAYYGLSQLARIKSGDKVLIHAAAGGVGLAALQIAQKAGAEIYATASPGKWEYLKSLGVEQVMNSRSLEFAAEIKAHTGGRGVDIILNSLTGEYIPANFSILAVGGRFVEIGKIGIWPEEEVRAIRPDVAYYPFDLGDVARTDPDLLQEMLVKLLAAFAKRELQPLRQTLFGIGEAAGAFRYMAQARHIGKVVVTQEDCRPGIRAEGTYLITGGLGALGLETARWLVKKGAGNLVLVGRGAGSARARQQIAALEDSGVRVNVVQVDLGKRQEVARLVREIGAEMAPLRGIVHAAGVLADGVLLRQDLAQLQKVMAPKAAGAWFLHEETRELKLDFFVCYSSIASVLGSAGQANYAAANAFMDSLAQERRRLGLPGLSINWGPWDQGMAAGLDRRGRERMTAMGLTPITSAQAFKVLDRLLLADETGACVLPVNWPVYLASQYQGVAPSFFAAVVERSPAPPFQADILEALAAAPSGERRAILFNYVRTQVASVLGEEGPGELQARQRLFDLGIDSLLAVELKNRFESGLGISLAATLVFDYPTIEALVERLGEDLPAIQEMENGVAEVGSAPPEADFAGFSQDEIATMLAQELKKGTDE